MTTTGGVVISPNIKKISDRIDKAGNIINKRTKEIIQARTPEYVRPVEGAPLEAPQAPTAVVTPSNESLSILDQIKAAKANLIELEELKKLKIAEKKAELELLEE